MRLRIIVVSLAVLMGAVPAAPAQDIGDTTALSARLDRIERDLNALERQVYRGGGAPAATAAGGGAAEGTGPVALQTEDRLARLEDQMRDLNGKIEVINNAISQLSQRLDKLSSDVDMRLSALEHGTAAPGAAPPPSRSGAAAGRGFGRRAGRRPDAESAVPGRVRPSAPRRLSRR